MRWLGLDLPEVITLRRQWLPDTVRCQSISRSMFEVEWLDEVQHINLHYRLGR